MMRAKNEIQNFEGKLYNKKKTLRFRNTLIEIIAVSEKKHLAEVKKITLI